MSVGTGNFGGAGLTGRIEKKIRVDDILSGLSSDHIDAESYFTSGEHKNAFYASFNAVLIYKDSSTDFAELDASCQMDAPDDHAPIPLACGVWHSMAIKRIYKAGTTSGLRIYLGGIRP